MVGNRSRINCHLANLYIECISFDHLPYCIVRSEKLLQLYLPIARICRSSTKRPNPNAQFTDLPSNIESYVEEHSSGGGNSCLARQESKFAIAMLKSTNPMETLLACSYVGAPGPETFPLDIVPANGPCKLQ